jgi:Tfp pilus assembly protein PilX
MLHPAREDGTLLVMGLLLIVLLSLLGVTLLTVASTEHSIAYNSVSSEGALMAAEAGVNRAINQLSPNSESSVQPVSANIGTGYSFRSGGRTATAPQNLEFVSTRTETGYSVAVGTGYNPAGYAFHTYRINATGRGPRSAIREVEIRAEYGPVAQ